MKEAALACDGVGHRHAITYLFRPLKLDDPRTAGGNARHPSSCRPEPLDIFGLSFYSQFVLTDVAC